MIAGHEAVPLVIGATMFLVTPFPNVGFAIDLSRPGAPVKWRYDPQLCQPPKAWPAATPSIGDSRTRKSTKHCPRSSALVFPRALLFPVARVLFSRLGIGVAATPGHRLPR